MENSLLEKYKDRIFLLNREVAEILRTTPSTLRQRLKRDKENPEGKYKGLYKKEGANTLWLKDKFYKYIGLDETA